MTLLSFSLESPGSSQKSVEYWVYCLHCAVAGECIIWTIFPPRALVSQVRCSSSQQQRGTLQLMSFIVTVPSWR